MGLLDLFRAGARRPHPAGGAEHPGPGIPLEQVVDILRHFPIGTRMRYIPEYQKNTVLDTIILGYGIDNHLVFSSAGVNIRYTGVIPTLEVTVDATSFTLQQVESLRLIIPQSDRSELDYSPAGKDQPTERLTEKAVNDFRRGNTITLFNKGTEGRIPYVDTTVARVAILDRGFYRNRKVAFLEPDPSTFELREQRHLHRVYTNVPAMICETAEGEARGCRVTDFSERFLRIEWEPTPSSPDEPPEEGQRFFLTVPADVSSRRFHLRGNVHRVDGGAIVLALNAILKGNRYRDFDLIDQLDMKTSLIHHPATEGSESAED